MRDTPFLTAGIVILLVIIFIIKYGTHYAIARLETEVRIHKQKLDFQIEMAKISSEERMQTKAEIHKHKVEKENISSEERIKKEQIWPNMIIKIFEAIFGSFVHWPIFDKLKEIMCSLMK